MQEEFMVAAALVESLPLASLGDFVRGWMAEAELGVWSLQAPC